MSVPAVWPIKIRVRRTGVWIDASEDEWCKREEVEPGKVWRYGFEYAKPPTRALMIPDYDYDEPQLLITKTDNELRILLEKFTGIYEVDIYAFDTLLWERAGGVARRHVGDTKTVPIPVIKPPPAPPAVPPAIPEVRIAESSLDKLAEKITTRLVRLPNRLDRVEIDTSNTKWVSLRKAGKLKPPVALGFWVEDIGGGFEYIILRKGLGPTKSRTAEADDKWELEFDDLLVKGSGTSGTAVIYYWWRE